ncbi:MAG: hypothetical protein L0H93_11100 [Nocardioides sp.]|nr:hypothetical protein [Nocardioides sp.]
MTWDEQLFSLFDDLEGQAESAYHLDRELEAADRAQAEYAAVTLAGRLQAGVGSQVSLQVLGVGPLNGVLARVASGWCLVEAHGSEWILRVAALESVRGLPPRAVPEQAWPVTAQVGLGSALRRLADARSAVQFRLVDGGQVEVRRVDRVGEDFVEALVGESHEPVLHAFSALAAIQSRH